MSSLIGPDSPDYHTVELIHLFDKLKILRAFVFDIDGVFTDNRIQVTETGEYLRTMNVRDGLVVKMAVEAGFQIGIITGGRSDGVKKRFTDLGVSEYYSGIGQKWPAMQAFLQRTGLPPTAVCYMGDDLPDVSVLRRVGLSCCPADAIPEVLAVCDYVSPLPGGAGCVRDVLEKAMKLQNKWKYDL